MASTTRPLMPSHPCKPMWIAAGVAAVLILIGLVVFREQCGLCGLRRQLRSKSSLTITQSAPPLAPVVEEMGIPATLVCASPLIMKLPTFLSHAEADHLVALARDRFEDSNVVVPGEGNKRDTKTRTSTSAFLKRGETPVVKAVEERAAAILGVPVSHVETLQVVHYDAGQMYTPHHDYFHNGTEDMRGGQRTHTIFAYLNDGPADGSGATEFPEVGYTCSPQKGVALLWLNRLPDGSMDSRTLHAGRPPSSGEKYGLNVWVRNAPQ